MSQFHFQIIKQTEKEICLSTIIYSQFISRLFKVYSCRCQSVSYMECQMGHAHFILSLSLSHLHAFFRLGLESNEDGCEPNDRNVQNLFFLFFKCSCAKTLLLPPS